MTESRGRASTRRRGMDGAAAALVRCGDRAGGAEGELGVAATLGRSRAEGGRRQSRSKHNRRLATTESSAPILCRLQR